MTERQADYTIEAGAPSPDDEQREERLFWIRIREAMLAMVDAIERRMGTNPRTAELRRLFKNQG